MADIQGTVLVIEDEAIVACDLRRFLDGTGYHVVGPVASLAEVLSKIAEEKVDGAVLDIAIADEATLRVVEALAEANVPVVLVNGRGISVLACEINDRPLLNNPYDYHSLLIALHGVMAGD